MELSATTLVVLLQIGLQQAIVLHVLGESYPFWKLPLSAMLIYCSHNLLPQAASASYLSMAVYIGALILSYALVFRKSLFISGLSGIGQMVLMTGVEYFVQTLYALLGNGVRAALYSLGPVAVRLPSLAVLLILLIAMSKTTYRLYQVNANGKQKNLWMLNLIFSLLYTLPNIMRYEGSDRQVLEARDIYSLLLVLVFFYLNFLTVRNLGKIADISQQLQVQQLYADTLQSSLHDLRDFKHDFSNILSTISGYVSIGNQEDLRQYINQVNRRMLNITTTDIVNTQLKNVPLLYGILVMELQHAELHNIQFQIVVLDELKLNYCEPLDFSRMMGILLDNALDAAKECDQRVVSLTVQQQYGQTVVEISNTYNGEVDLDAIFTRGYTTKEGHTGFGLAQVCEIVEKYGRRGMNMQLETNTSGPYFYQRLII